MGFGLGVVVVAIVSSTIGHALVCLPAKWESSGDATLQLSTGSGTDRSWEKTPTETAWISGSYAATSIPAAHLPDPKPQPNEFSGLTQFTAQPCTMSGMDTAGEGTWPANKSPGLDGFTGEFYHIKKNLHLSFSKYSKKLKRREHSQIHSTSHHYPDTKPRQRHHTHTHTHKLQANIFDEHGHNNP